jgi:hypothetical protein
MVVNLAVQDPDSVTIERLDKAIEVFNLLPSGGLDTSSSLAFTEVSSYLITELAKRKLGKHPVDYVEQDIVPLLDQDGRDPMILASQGIREIMDRKDSYKSLDSSINPTFWLNSTMIWNIEYILRGAKKYLEGRAPAMIAFYSGLYLTSDEARELARKVADQSMEQMLSEFPLGSFRRAIISEGVEKAKISVAYPRTKSFGGLVSLYNSLAYLEER